MLTPSETARLARAELETIASALRVDELAKLVALGRRLLEHEAERAQNAGSFDRTTVRA
jgi:hypothetical protein